MFRHSVKLTAICVLFAAGGVKAEMVMTPVVGVGGYPAAVQYGDNNVLVQHHCSTAKEGALRGWADLVRSYGEAARNFGEARCYVALAHEQELQNHQLAVAQYYERKAMYEASKVHPDKFYLPYETVSKSDTPKPVTPVVSNDGRINWPVALKTDSCCSARQALEIYFNHRGPGYSTGIGTPEYETAHAAIGELTNNLKSRITEVHSGDYMLAKNFLKNLEKAAG